MVKIIKKRKVVRKYANISNEKLYLLAETKPKYRAEANRRMQKSARRTARKSKGLTRIGMKYAMGHKI